MLFSGIVGVSSVFSSTVSKTEEVGAKSALEIIVKPKLHIINKVAIIAVALVIKLPAVLENMKFSCETPIPSAPPSDFCIKTNKTRIIANMMFNMGRPRLSKFKGMKRGVDARDWNAAADEMVDSKWYRQVTKRADRLVERMRNV